MSVKSKIHVALFLLLRPSYFPDFFRRLKNNFALKLLPKQIGRNKSVSEKWASSHAVDIVEAMRLLGYEIDADLPIKVVSALKEAEEIYCASNVSMGSGTSVELLYRLCEELNVKKVVETGVAYGFSSLAILLSISQRSGQLVSVDMPYPGRSNEDSVGCVVPKDFCKYWSLYRFPDYVGLPKALKKIEYMDLCHYDSDKSYEGRAWAYPLLWRSLRSGGVLVSDDVEDNTAFRDFAAENTIEPIVVCTSGAGSGQKHYIGILVKP